MKATSNPSDLLLLDVNVLVAMAWPNHRFHRAAIQRLESGRNRWATCALTQLILNSAAASAGRRAFGTTAEFEDICVKP